MAQHRSLCIVLAFLVPGCAPSAQATRRPGPAPVMSSSSLTDTASLTAVNMAGMAEPPLASAQPLATALHEDGLPLAPGARWEYRAQVAWMDGIEQHERTVSWTMRVEDMVQRGRVRAFAVHGLPLDLAWYEPGKQPGTYVIVQVGASRYYLGPPNTLARMRDTSDVLVGLVQEDDLLLELPLRKGRIFGPAEQITREDQGYAWHVVAADTVDLSHIAGVHAPGPLPRFTMRMHTGPDEQTMEIVPGVGILRYTYQHHGTTAEADVKLIAYHPGTALQPPAPQASPRAALSLPRPH